MIDDGAIPPEFEDRPRADERLVLGDESRLEDLVGELRDFAYRQARPRLSAQQVRRHGQRRRRTRQGAAAVGTGALAVAGVCFVALLVGSHSPAPVVRPAVGHSVSAAPTASAHPAPAPTADTTSQRSSSPTTSPTSTSG